VVCGGIHMSDIPSFPYALLWGERSLRSVAHLTRADGRELLDLAGRIPLRAEVHRYPLQRAADALNDLRHGRFSAPPCWSSRRPGLFRRCSGSSALGLRAGRRVTPAPTVASIAHARARLDGRVGPRPQRTAMRAGVQAGSNVSDTSTCSTPQLPNVAG
jgi:hypothetical protein